MNFNKDYFAQTLRAIQEEGSISARKIAQKIGVSAATYCRVSKDNGKSFPPDIEVFYKCFQWIKARIVTAQMEDFFCGKELQNEKE